MKWILLLGGWKEWAEKGPTEDARYGRRRPAKQVNSAKLFGRLFSFEESEGAKPGTQ